jgi:hypothetical protein
MNLVEKKDKHAYKQKKCNLAKKIRNLNFKKIVNKILKLIVKELKFNVNCQIKIGRNHNIVYQV